MTSISYFVCVFTLQLAGKESSYASHLSKYTPSSELNFCFVIKIVQSKPTNRKSMLFYTHTDRHAHTLPYNGILKSWLIVRNNFYVFDIKIDMSLGAVFLTIHIPIYNYTYTYIYYSLLYISMYIGMRIIQYTLLYILHHISVNVYKFQLD